MIMHYDAVIMYFSTCHVCMYVPLPLVIQAADLLWLKVSRGVFITVFITDPTRPLTFGIQAEHDLQVSSRIPFCDSSHVLEYCPIGRQLLLT